MRLLLDTHAFIWHATGSSELSPVASAAISDLGNEANVSIASLWEIGIKESLGKLTIVSLDELIERMKDLDFRLLPLDIPHIRKVRLLPHHHRDPFDRMLVAQALEDDLQMVSCDTALDAYGVKRVW